MRIILKIRQVYTCGNDALAVRFIYDSNDRISECVEVAGELEFDLDEIAVPNVEVTNEFFTKVINNPRLKNSQSPRKTEEEY